MKTPPVGVGNKMYTSEQRDKMRQEFARINPTGLQLGPTAPHEQPCEALVEKTQSFFPQCKFTIFNIG